ncbi:MAG: methyl-accepting chemotaxis protein, partial [Burkholderiaceae bacterium]|nr:methyl-accepting chemotaxis protein [Burkholderiaceae bacterium]
MKITDWKIGARLGASFAIILLIMIIMAALGINRLAVVNQASTDMAENRIPKLLQVQEIQEQLNTMSRAVRNALLLKNDREGMKKESARIYEARKVIATTFDKLDKSMVTPKGRELIKATIEKRMVYVASLDKLLKQIEEARHEEAMSHMFGDFRKAQYAYLAQLEAFQKYLVDAMNKGNKEADDNYAMARMLLIAMTVTAVVVGILVALFATRSITRPLDEAVKVAETVASGDLTTRIDVKSKDETGQLMQALKNMNDSLINIVGQVRTGTDTIATASAQIAAGNQDLSSRTEEQASSLEETASSMEELTSTVRQNADNARQANQLAVTASDVAVKG